MTNIKRGLALVLIGILWYNAKAQGASSSDSLAFLNLHYNGLKKVASYAAKGNNSRAAGELLDYFRNKTNAEFVRLRGQKTSQETFRLANDIIEHKFKPHKGYGSFFYGTDINWQLRPVKDQLVSTFLHRTTFWKSLSDAYLATGDEKYAEAWVVQVRDWLKKNPQGAYPDDREYAWKAFVVSFRLNNWADFFKVFVHSPHFSPAFLIQFLRSYSEQANYVIANYTDIGNHRLYEAEHLILAGTMFPELNGAAEWRKSGVGVLSAEIKKQVFPDGMQFELSPGYHIGAIGTFLRALEMTRQERLDKEFPQYYSEIIEKMVMAVPKFSFPDYTFPLYGNSFLTNKKNMLANYRRWLKTFPDNEQIRYYATDGLDGAKPSYRSSALLNAGFYAFRNGIDKKATVMQIKAGPPAEFHSHPDNGNFELWVRGRNFTPDAGSYIYANVPGIESAKRDWYRSTKAHQTLTLNNGNITNNARMLKWEPTGKVQILTYTNPSYKDLDHRRSILFIDSAWFLIVDRAQGSARGDIGIHFNFREDAPVITDTLQRQIFTRYTDGNNLLVRSLNENKVMLSGEQSYVSYQYQKETPRAEFVFHDKKDSAGAKVFVTLIYPFNGTTAPKVAVKQNSGNDYSSGKIDLTITIDGKGHFIKTNLL